MHVIEFSKNVIPSDTPVKVEPGCGKYLDCSFIVGPDTTSDEERDYYYRAFVDQRDIVTKLHVTNCNNVKKRVCLLSWGGWCENCHGPICNKSVKYIFNKLKGKTFGNIYPFINQDLVYVSSIKKETV